MRVASFDGGAAQTTKNRKVNLMLRRFLNLAEEIGIASKACQLMGVSRDIFYRYKHAVDSGGFVIFPVKPQEHMEPLITVANLGFSNLPDATGPEFD